MISEHRLAERLGMTVARLRVEMDSEEFTRWIAFDEYEHRRREREAEEAKANAEAEHARAAKKAKDAEPPELDTFD